MVQWSFPGRQGWVPEPSVTPAVPQMEDQWFLSCNLLDLEKLTFYFYFLHLGFSNAVASRSQK